MVVVMQTLERHAIQIVNIQADVGTGTVVELVILADRLRETVGTTHPTEQCPLPVGDRESGTAQSGAGSFVPAINAERGAYIKVMPRVRAQPLEFDFRADGPQLLRHPAVHGRG